MLGFASAASRAAVTDYACVAAFRVAVNRMIYRAIAYADFFHIPYDLFKGAEVIERVAVKLNIADVSRIAQGMIASIASFSKAFIL